MRILLVNPNTSEAFTASITETARAAAAPGTEIVPVTAAFGARVIGTRTESAVAEHACLETMAHHAPGCDAAIVAASFDSGVRAGREMLAVPVLGITEASLHVASMIGSRIGAVVLNPRIEPVLRETVRGYGFQHEMCGVRALPRTVLDALKNPDVLAEAIVQSALHLVEQDGAEVIILIGAVLGAMPARVQAKVPVPVIEGLSCAVALAEALVRLRIPKARTGSFAALPHNEQIGLGPALSSQFG